MALEVWANLTELGQGMGRATFLLPWFTLVPSSEGLFLTLTFSLEPVWLHWFTWIIQDKLYLKILNLTSAKSLSPCTVTHSQVPWHRTWTSRQPLFSPYCRRSLIRRRLWHWMCWTALCLPKQDKRELERDGGGGGWLEEDVRVPRGSRELPTREEGPEKQETLCAELSGAGLPWGGS